MNTLVRTATLISCFEAAILAGPLKVVCFGDSTTAPRPGVVTYCESLQKAGTEGDRAEVVNRGVPGDTTAKARARFERDVLSFKPDLVFILFGINDSSVDVWKNPPETRPRVELAEFAANLGFFVDTLKQMGTRVVVMTFNPMRWTPRIKDLYGKPPYRPDDIDGFEVGRAEYLAVIREVAAGKRVDLVDVYAAWQAYAAQKGHTLDDLLLDGIHPNSLGQSLTTNLVRPVLDSALRQKGAQ